MPESVLILFSYTMQEFQRMQLHLSVSSLAYPNLLGKKDYVVVVVVVAASLIQAGTKEKLHLRAKSFSCPS